MVPIKLLRTPQEILLSPRLIDPANPAVVDSATPVTRQRKESENTPPRLKKYPSCIKRLVC
jgi:hypothetical protein